MNKSNVQNMPADLRKKLFASSDQVQFAEADMKAVEESIIRHNVSRLNVMALTGCAGKAVSHANAMARTLFKLGMQNQ